MTLGIVLMLEEIFVHSQFEIFIDLFKCQEQALFKKSESEAGNKTFTSEKSTECTWYVTAWDLDRQRIGKKKSGKRLHFNNIRVFLSCNFAFVAS